MVLVLSLDPPLASWLSGTSFSGPCCSADEDADGRLSFPGDFQVHRQLLFREPYQSPDPGSANLCSTCTTFLSQPPSRNWHRHIVQATWFKNPGALIPETAARLWVRDDEAVWGIALSLKHENAAIQGKVTWSIRSLMVLPHPRLPLMSSSKNFPFISSFLSVLFNHE